VIDTETGQDEKRINVLREKAIPTLMKMVHSRSWLLNRKTSLRINEHLVNDRASATAFELWTSEQSLKWTHLYVLSYHKYKSRTKTHWMAIWTAISHQTTTSAATFQFRFYNNR